MPDRDSTAKSAAPPTLHDVVEIAELANVTHFELSAVREKAADPTGPAEPDGAELQVSQEMNYSARDDGQAFRVWLRSTVVAPGRGTVVVGVDGEWTYESGDPDAISEPVMLEFINNVAVMVLLPFIRETVADLSRRVFGTGLLLRTWQRGEIIFAKPEKLVEEGTAHLA